MSAQRPTVPRYMWERVAEGKKLPRGESVRTRNGGVAPSLLRELKRGYEAR